MATMDESGIPNITVRFPSGSNDTWTRSRNAVEVLKAFMHGQPNALQIWKENLSEMQTINHQTK